MGKQKCVKRYGLDKLLRVEDLICEGEAWKQSNISKTLLLIIETDRKHEQDMRLHHFKNTLK